MAFPILPFVLMALGGAAKGMAKTEEEYNGGGNKTPPPDFQAKMSALGQLAGRKRGEWIVDAEEKSRDVEQKRLEDERRRKMMEEGRWA